MQQAYGQPVTGRIRKETALRRRLLPSPGGNVPRQRLLGALAPSLALALVVLLAFPFSALSLWTGLQTDTPLAYQGLIPVLAFLAAVAHAWRSPTYVWRDTVTELVVALPFLTAALALMYAGTRIGSIYFWYNRSDLLALALFGVGAAVILFGVGAVTRSWFAVLYLVLVWPAPYQAHLSSAIIQITEATVAAVDAGLRGFDWSGVTPIGEAVYRVKGPDGAEQAVGVDSPCAGAAGMFGFLVVAIPALYLTTGSWLRKIGWLALGLLLLWALNVGRIFSLFWLATTHGVQSDVFWWTHATLGVLLFTVAIVLMLYLAYRLGFRFERSNEIASAPTMLRIRRHGSAPLLVLAVLALAVLLGSMNRNMIDAVGLSARLADGTSISTFAAALPAVDGSAPRYVDQYDWSRQFFGRNSTYQRYVYRVPSGRSDGGNLIWVDTVVTDERERLDLFNVQGCYNFHGYEMAAVSTVDVGYGIVAQQVQFIVPDSLNRWVALTWTWPVSDGGRDLHERVTILQYVAAEDAGDTIAAQDDTLSALERLFGIGNGNVAVGPEAEEVFDVGTAIIESQLDNHTAGQ
jgi:exosortase/archaeosortase family protein